MTDNNKESIEQRVQAYQDIVRQYEELDAEIDTLIMSNQGASKNMSPADRERYQLLAQQRRDLLNEMRMLELELLDDENEL